MWDRTARAPGRTRGNQRRLKTCRKDKTSASRLGTEIIIPISGYFHRAPNYLCAYLLGSFIKTCVIKLWETEKVRKLHDRDQGSIMTSPTLKTTSSNKNLSNNVYKVIAPWPITYSANTYRPSTTAWHYCIYWENNSGFKGNLWSYRAYCLEGWVETIKSNERKMLWKQGMLNRECWVAKGSAVLL